MDVHYQQHVYDGSCSGYTPPEFINGRKISNKFDIFSLGVIMIKIMAGRSGYSNSADMPSQEFINIVRKCVAFTEIMCNNVSIS
jgi:serine/threonine protein kinase